MSICNNQDNLSIKAVQSQIEVFVHGETEKDGFHHVLTEIAILRVRKSRRPDRHGMVPVALDGAHHLRYLSVFGDSDITFKLKSISAADKHALFFQLLEQIFVQHNAFANDLKNCYKKVADDLNLSANGKEIISRGQFHECLNSNMTRMYHKHWSTFSTAMRNGKFNEYAGILGKHVLDILDQNKAKERREILQWVSPIASPPMPGKYGDGRAKRLEGTCDWVIEDERFVKWYESDGSAIISLQGTSEFLMRLVGGAKELTFDQWEWGKPTPQQESLSGFNNLWVEPNNTGPLHISTVSSKTKCAIML